MSFLSDSGPKIPNNEFRLLRDLINEFCGIMLGNDTKFIVERRLHERLKSLGLSNYAQYYDYLRYHPDAQSELEKAVEILSTNETYFFREEYQLRAFSREVLPQLKEKAEAIGKRRLAIWSAGCSTGEEVYTVAMILVDSGLFDGWEVRIFGSDISRQVLHRARQATYSESSFRAMPRKYDRYFIRTPSGRRVHPKIRSLCHFGHLNLLSHGRSAIVGSVDAIFCRNVLIYFDLASRRKVLETFYERLNPGGYLLLGHSESLLNASTAFELVHVSTDLLYRRPYETYGSPTPKGNATE